MWVASTSNRRSTSFSSSLIPGHVYHRPRLTRSMNPTTQTHLPLTIHERTSLVTVDTARAVMGVDSQTVLSLVENGRILWAFDVSAKGRGDTREIRIWRASVAAYMAEQPQPMAASGPTPGVERIIGPTPARIRSSRVAQILSVHVCTILHLHRAGELAGEITPGESGGTCRWITRDSFAAWLRRRLIH